MRNELEAAMGRVITSRQACADFVDDPRGFASAYALDDAEVESLVAMRDDLADLMPGFTQKRMGMLRRSSHRTLGLLGDRAHPLLAEFCDANAPVDGIGAGQTAFADYLIECTATLAPTIPAGPVAAEMARFERAVIEASWAPRRLSGGVANLERAPFDPSRGLRLAPGASVRHFTWDLRQLRQFDAATADRLPVDPCDLLIFHTGGRDGARFERLLPFGMAALLTIRDSPGITADDACSGLDHRDRAVNTLSRLSSQGAIEWS